MMRLATTLSIVVSLSFAAVGCAGVDLEQQVEDLTREREDLQRRNTQLEGQLAAAEAQASSLEREVKEQKKSTPKTSPADVELSKGLKDSGVGVRRRGNDTVLDLPSDLFFSPGSCTLSKAGEKALAQVAEIVRKHQGGSMVRIEGHSDSDPIRRTKGKYHCNWELSFERAHSVAHFLIEKGGVEPGTLALDCYGEHHPQDPKNKSKNRRVEIVLGR